MVKAHGFDVSHWNAPNLPAARWWFLIAKATEGTGYTDPTAAHWRATVTKAGKRFGLYHFARPDTGNGATAEADWFVTAGNPQPGDLVVLDIEVHGPSPAAWVNEWCTRVHQRTGARPIVYTNLSVGDTLDGCGHHPLWIADPSSRAGHPRLPAPWSSWVMHQYGTLSGFDRDIAAGRFHDVLAPLRVPVKAAPAPTPITKHATRLGLIARIRRLLDQLQAKS